jgi:hypothetical protein
LPLDDGGEELDLAEDDEEAPDEVEDGEGDGEDAGGDDEAEGDADDEGDGRQERQTRHVESRYQRNRREAQEAKREAADLRRRLDDLERRGPSAPQGPDPQAAAREEQEFYQSLELMAPAQAIMAVRDRERRTMGMALQQTRAELLDEVRKQRWETSCESNWTKARLSPQVQTMIDTARRQGNTSLDYETAYRWALGDEIDRRSRVETPRQRAAAGRRVQRQTVRPGSGRGDAPRGGNRRSQDADDEALLRGITIADL